MRAAPRVVDVGGSGPTRLPLTFLEHRIRPPPRGADQSTCSSLGTGPSRVSPAPSRTPVCRLRSIHSRTTHTHWDGRGLGSQVQPAPADRGPQREVSGGRGRLEKEDEGLGPSGPGKTCDVEGSYVLSGPVCPPRVITDVSRDRTVFATPDCRGTPTGTPGASRDDGDSQDPQRPCPFCRSKF